MALNDDIYQSILNGNATKAMEATRGALAMGTDPLSLIQDSMVPAIEEVSKLYECEEYFVPELLLAGRAMKNAMQLLTPLMSASGQSLGTRVLIGTVKGDLHDIGKTSLRRCLKAAGSM